MVTVGANGLVVHLVDSNNQLGDAQRLGELSVLPRLSPFLESGLKLTLAIER
jgi:hypothetical protein